MSDVLHTFDHVVYVEPGFVIKHYLLPQLWNYSTCHTG
uniref:Uncharacterized protein n=1 Tax=Anguilla anguilla TaxID=7936 RepID=A0A0E9UMQ3_ANGAN